MKRFLASFVARRGIGEAANAACRVPTIAADELPIEPVSHPPSDNDVLMHEHEWAQFELLPSTRLPEIRRHLAAVRVAAGMNEVDGGWITPHPRRLQRGVVLAGPEPLRLLEKTLKLSAGVAPTLFAQRGVAGRLKGGFSFPLHQHVTLYGYVTAHHVPVLGLLPGESADDAALSIALARLPQAWGLVLVDWCAQRVLGRDGLVL
ncbi:hypothetical protein [Pinirhizobacter sp.]|jgi:hypothetical protein|uniref:hypothetical protein n=1 Tax=Pinirhizobacter sp. TaxID=2950432 RepID=UPI002F4053FB